jgi:hypothetical protein
MSNTAQVLSVMELSADPAAAHRRIATDGAGFGNLPHLRLRPTRGK